MKILFVLLFLLTSCAATNVYSVRNFIDFSDDLNRDSLENFKNSRAGEFQPPKEDRKDYMTHLESLISYRHHLFLECIMILQKEHGLILEKPIYASIPKWNNVQNWYSTIFNYHIVKGNSSIETKAECDLVPNAKNEVDQYQIQEYYPEVLKN